MARSRSSFDLDSAIAAATSLTATPDARRKEHTPGLAEGGAPLVSFAPRTTAEPEQAPPSGTPSSTGYDVPPSSTTDVTHDGGLQSALPPSASDLAGARDHALELPTLARAPASTAHAGIAAPSLSDATAEAAPDGGRPAAARPPPLPDLSAVLSPVLRCERLVAWIVEATGATDVFLADASGLPIAGAVSDSEALLAASGWVASAVGSLSAALPGTPSRRFELHIGEGPVFQLIGLQISSAAYVVGMVRATPLTPRQAHAIRIGCRHALGDALGGAP